MKFKKFLALSLAAAMMTTGIPGVGMLDGAVNVMAAVNVNGTGVTLEDAVGELESKVSVKNISYDSAVSAISGNGFVYYGVDYTPSTGTQGSAVAGNFGSGDITTTDGKAIAINLVEKGKTAPITGGLDKTKSYELLVTSNGVDTSVARIPITFTTVAIADANKNTGKFTSSDGTTSPVSTVFMTNSGSVIGNKNEYTGKDLKPSAEKTVVNINGAKAKYGSDYTIKYYKGIDNGVNITVGSEVTEIKNAGDYFVAVEGLGKYAGSAIYYDYTVKPFDLANAGSVGAEYITQKYAVKFDTTKMGFTGKELAPSLSNITVYEADSDGTNVITKGSPIFTLSADDININYWTDSNTNGTVESGETQSTKKAPGEYNVTIEGKGNFKGNVTSNDKVLTIVKNLSAGDAVAYVNNDTVAGATGGDLAVSISSGTYQLTASDYDVTWTDEDNKTVAAGVALEAGKTYTAKIVGKGCYEDTIYASVKYGEKGATKLNNISSCTVEVISDTSYTGREVKPNIIVKDSSDKIVPASNYSVQYVNNIDKCESVDGDDNADDTEPMLIVTGKGDYCNSTKVEFAIYGQSMTNGTVSSIPAKTYTGQVQNINTKDITVTDGSGVVLSTSDYIISDYYKVAEEDGDLVSDNTDKGFLGYAVERDSATGEPKSISPKDAGTYIVKIKLQGNYSNTVDSLYQVYTINPASISSGYQFTSGINLDKNDYKVSYTGKIIDALPGAKLTMLDEKGKETDTHLTLGTDYKINMPKDALEKGKYTATIVGTNNYTGEINVDFEVVKTVGDVIANYDVDVEGEGNKAVYTVKPNIIVKEDVKQSVLTEDTDYKVSYYRYQKTAKPATVTEYDFEDDDNYYELIGGAVTQLSTGTSYIAVVEGTGDYEGTSFAVLDIASKANLTSLKDATITFTSNYGIVPSYATEYTGSGVGVGRKGSANAVIVKDGNKTLTEDVDFTVQYANNIDVSKDAKVIIVGKGDYYGSVSASFEITQRTMSTNGLTLSTATDPDNDAVGTYSYTGKALDATVTVTDKINNKKINLVDGTDYEVSYAKIVPDGNSAKKENGVYVKGEALSLEDITEVGKYLVITKGIGNYTGELVQLVSIEKLSLATGVTIKGNDVIANAEGVTPEFTFINKLNGSEMNIDASNYTVKLYADKGCKEPLDSVTEVGTYYAKLKGTNNATGTSDAIAFNVVEGKDIAGADVTALDTTENPKLLVVLDGKVLEADTDYTVEYVVGEDGKTGTAIVTGAGKYAGTVSTTYEIKKDIVALSKASVKLSKTSYGYNGKAKKPGVTVKVDGVTVDPSEYTVSYSNNKNAGTGKVTITAKDDSEVIKGSKTMTITIAKASNKVTASNVTKSYKVKTLKAKKATFKLSAKAKAGKLSYKKVSSGKKIAVSKNGTVTVAKGLKKGTYKVKVKVTAASSTNYKAASKTMTVTVKVK